MDQTKPIIINNFGGGYCGNLPISNLAINQASDLDNIVIKPNGQGFRSRLGNTKLNASALNSGANIQGLGFLLQAGGSYWLTAIAGAKFYTSASIGSSFTDSTGAYGGITAGVGDIWDLFTFNDAIIGFGGSSSSPDAPIYWPGTGNVAALGGTPPSAYGGLSANNRVFAFRTSANPSTMYWSVLGNAQDWTSAGSGSAVIGSLSDNERVTAATVLSTNYMLVFKQNSTYQMVISTAPFPVYSLFDSTGCVGKHAAINIDGTVYFITSELQMKSTDGENLQHYPPAANDLWYALPQDLQERIEGFRQKGSDYDWIVWLVRSSSGSENKYAIVWDLLNKCWLRHSTGYNFNVGIRVNQAIATPTNYCGGFDGFIYKLDQATTYSDASTGAAISSYWRSGWINPSVNNEIVQVRKAILTYQTKASGNITLNYGFDFNLDQSSVTYSQTATGSELYTSRLNLLTHRGNFFNYKIGLSSSTIDMSVQSLTLRGKVYGQKRISAS